MRFAKVLALSSWFVGGVILGLIEIVTLPSDPNLSTLLQILPLFFLAGGIWFVIEQYRKLSETSTNPSRHLRRVMIVGWIAVFGVDAGVASIDNMSSQIFHMMLPYYYQGVSLAQKITALAGIFVLGEAAILATRTVDTVPRRAQRVSDFWEKPVTNIGFTSLLLGVVLGLGQYWSSVVFTGFILLLAGAFMYPIGLLTEKDTATTS